MADKISTREEFGRILDSKLRRKILGDSMTRLGMSYHRIDSLRSGRSFPATREDLESLCKECDIDVSQLDLHSLVSPKNYHNFGINGEVKDDGNGEVRDDEKIISTSQEMQGSSRTMKPAIDSMQGEKISSREEFGRLVRSRGKVIYGNFTELARDLSINYSALQGTMKGVTFPKDLKTLRRYCGELDIDIATLDLRNIVGPDRLNRYRVDNQENAAINGDLQTSHDEETLDESKISGEPAKKINHNSIFPCYAIGKDGRYGRIIGESEVMLEVFRLLDNVVRNPDQESVVLITGETGTGKELVAKALHYNGSRSGNPFIDVNINTLTETILESTLFGHRKGSFTDANDDRRGLFEIVEYGTLFLDEIGSLSIDAQVKLLRVLQERKFYKMGNEKHTSFNGRVVVATKEDLEKLVKIGKFREDLFHRFNVVGIHLPRLMERGADKLLLFSYFVHKHNQEYKTSYRTYPSDETERVLMGYEFPGNIRELENLVKKAIFRNPDYKEIIIKDILKKKELNNRKQAEARSEYSKADRGKERINEQQPEYKPLNQGNGISQYASKREEAFVSALMPRINPDFDVLRRAGAEELLKYVFRSGCNIATCSKITGVKRTTLFEKIKNIGLDLNFIKHTYAGISHAEP